jgi:hypothetical protein
LISGDVSHLLESPTTISGVTTSYYLLTGLSGSTQYIYKVIPYRDNTTGDYSSDFNGDNDGGRSVGEHVCKHVFFGVDSSSVIVELDPSYYPWIYT